MHPSDEFEAGDEAGGGLVRRQVDAFRAGCHGGHHLTVHLDLHDGLGELQEEGHRDVEGRHDEGFAGGLYEAVVVGAEYHEAVGVGVAVFREGQRDGRTLLSGSGVRVGEIGFACHLEIGDGVCRVSCLALAIGTLCPKRVHPESQQGNQKENCESLHLLKNYKLANIRKRIIPPTKCCGISIFFLIFAVLMRYLFTFILSFVLVLAAMSQDAGYERFASAFEAAYEACPDVPRGVLEAVSYTNTQFHHLTDADYHHDGSDAMPRAYGLMGLVNDGKGYFHENLHTVARLSGMAETDILNSPEANVMAYAKALEKMLEEETYDKTTSRVITAIEKLSELPAEDDRYPMEVMLYSVCEFLNDENAATRCGFDVYHIDTKALFPEYHALLTAQNVSVSREGDYARALWDPAPECNYGERVEPISGVVIHYTEGSYAGCISWFKNCDAQVSSHYVIRSRDGQVTQMVREADKAWHARSANAYTIGIEHEAYGDIISYFTPEMYASSADLVHDISTRYASIDGHRTFYRDTLDNGTCLNNGLHDLGGATACTQIRGHQHYPEQSHTDPGPYWDWNYYYKLINAAEAAPIVLQGSNGTLDHENYGDDERKIWVIEAPEGTQVTITFSSFQLETNYDFLWIYDGDDVFAPKLGRWNTKSPGSVTSSGNTMCLEFRSDCRTTAAGWKATWEAAVPAPPEPPAPPFQEGVFPNPVDDVLYVNMEEIAIHQAALYDMLGRQVTTMVTFINEGQIDTRHLQAGVYVLRYGKPRTRENAARIVKL